MISPASARSFLRNSAGFTLIELLVVILIIALLAGILVPTVMRAQRGAKRTKTAADLAAIGVALDAYHADAGDYPRVEAPGTGFAVLCRALIAPGPAAGPLVQTPPGAAPYSAGTYASTGAPAAPPYVEYVAIGVPDPNGGFSTSTAVGTAPDWAAFVISDGLDGPGYRARFGSQPKNAYLQPEKFNVRGMAMYDGWGHPILYFPAAVKKPAQNTAAPGWPLLVGAGSLYSFTDNQTFFLRPAETIAANGNKALARMDALIVNNSANFDGVIQAGEAPATTGNYVLWSAGTDGKFGVTYAGANPTQSEIESCDDVTNFSK